MKKYIKVVVKNVGEAPQVCTIKNDWNTFTDIVGDGDLHTPLLIPKQDHTIDFISDLHGFENGKKANFEYCGSTIYGNVIVVTTDKKNKYRSLSNKQIENIFGFFSGNEPAAVPDKINVLFKQIGKEPRMEEIDNTYETLRGMIGGPMRLSYVKEHDTMIISNKTGYENDMGLNVLYGMQVFRGDIIAAGNNNGTPISLSDTQAENMYDLFEYGHVANHPNSEVLKHFLDIDDLKNGIEM